MLNLLNSECLALSLGDFCVIADEELTSPFWCDSAIVQDDTNAFYRAYDLGLDSERVSEYRGFKTSLAMACVLDTLPSAQLLTAKIAHNLI